LRIGIRGIGEESTKTYIPSDTLYSAFFNSYSKLFGYEQTSELIEKFINREPPFLISSTYPYLKLKNKVLYFLPKPPIETTYIEDSQYLLKRKSIKSAYLVELPLFEKIIKKKITFTDLVEMIVDKKAVISNNIIFVDNDAISSFLNHENDENKKNVGVNKITLTSHNTLDRLNLYSAIYFSSSVYFQDNAGLYFIVKFLDNNFKTEFFSTMRLLSDDGIGGNRSIGHGVFNFDESKITITEPDNASRLITLSMYIPSEKELEIILRNKTQVKYSLTKIGGFIYSLKHHGGLRRPQIYLFNEGAILPKFDNPEILGSAPILMTQGDTKIIRVGYTLTVGVVM